MTQNLLIMKFSGYRTSNGLKDMNRMASHSYCDLSINLHLLSTVIWCVPVCGDCDNALVKRNVLAHD